MDRSTVARGVSSSRSIGTSHEGVRDHTIQMDTFLEWYPRKWLDALVEETAPQPYSASITSIGISKRKRAMCRECKKFV